MKTVLAVDDSATMREMVAFVLESAGYRVLEAEDGAKGLERARATPVDLVITDQNMPNMDGITLVRSLRELREYKAIPILLLTTESSDTMKSQGRAAGATGWLVKPFDPATLLEVVRKVLR
ncbi:MAG: response regulator [Betaproteobacteria bacterium]|nr:response regulator [Betaproteobacteria bacterium]